MTATIDQIAREIAIDLFANEDTYHDRIAAILRRHWPAGAVVVTAKMFRDALNAAWTDANGGGYDDDQGAAYLNARAVPAVVDPNCIWARVVPRPVREVSQLVVPENGQYASRRADGSAETYVFWARNGEVLPEKHAAIRRIDTDVPTTWIKRTTTREPRAWEASDFPADADIVAYYADGSRTCWTNRDGEHRATGFNRYNATGYIVLPNTLEVG
jgi:hypothetical protein